MFDIWREKSDLAEQVYCGENYRIVDNPAAESTICAIYCSSNNIWFPNEEAFFRRSFIESDYYEWQKIRIKNAKKEIWIRDIYKSWYVTGINREICSVEKLIDFLRKETAGYEVVLIGSSAGGYLAALLSKPLSAFKAIVFSAQFDLNLPGAINNNPFLQKYKGTEREAYYDLSEYLKYSDAEIFYIYPNKNPQDIGQMETVKQLKSIHMMGMNSKRHGMVVYKCCVDELINMSKEQLKAVFERYRDKNPFILSVNIVGVIKTLQYVASELRSLLRKVIAKRNAGASGSGALK